MDQDGIITCLSVGKAIITATAENGVSGQITINVTLPVPLSTTQLTLCVGDTVTVDILNPQTKVTMSSAHPAVVTVSDDCTLTALAPGMTLITAEDVNNGLRSTFILTVVENLSTLRLPAAIRSLEADAFALTAAEKVVLPAGLTSLDSRAFAGMVSLKQVWVLSDSVHLPRGLYFINAVIFCAPGSQAQQDAAALGLRYVLIDK